MSIPPTKLKIKVLIPTFDRQGYMLPIGSYEFKVTRVRGNHLSGFIGEVEFMLPIEHVLKMVSNHQFRLTVRTQLPRIHRTESIVSPVHGNSCMICLGTMEVHNYSVTLGCNHKFHRSCIARWLGNNNNCPVCRTRLSIVQRTRLGVTPEPAPRRRVRRYRSRANLPVLRFS